MTELLAAWTPNWTALAVVVPVVVAVVGGILAFQRRRVRRLRATYDEAAVTAQKVAVWVDESQEPPFRKVTIANNSDALFRNCSVAYTVDRMGSQSTLEEVSLAYLPPNTTKRIRLPIPPSPPVSWRLAWMQFQDESGRVWRRERGELVLVFTPYERDHKWRESPGPPASGD